MKAFVGCFCAMVLVAVPAGSPYGAQRSDTDPVYREQMRVDKEVQARMTSPLPQVNAKVDGAQVKREAEELARLAQSLPLEVAKAETGTVSKNLKGNLKKIEKLCKQLRSELAL